MEHALGTSMQEHSETIRQKQVLETNLEAERTCVRRLSLENTQLIKKLSAVLKERERQRKAAVTRRRKNSNRARDLKRMRGKLAALKVQISDVTFIKDRKSNKNKSHVTGQAAVAFLNMRDKGKFASSRVAEVTNSMGKLRNDGKLPLRLVSPLKYENSRSWFISRILRTVSGN